MEFYMDDDATPRPLRVANTDEWAERSPYIPRRKSSCNDGPVHPTSTVDLTRPFRVHQHKKTSRDSYLQKARFPIDGYDPPPGRALHQLSLLGGYDVRRPQSAIAPSSSRRFLNRMFSNLAFPSNTSRRQSRDSNTSNAGFARTHRRSDSETSSASSLSSLSTTPSSPQDNTVRRRRQLAVNPVQSAMSDSPNPLRAPPSSLLGSTKGNSTVLESTEFTSSTTESVVESRDIPILAFAEVQYLTFAGNDQSKNGISCSIWVVLKILCSENQGADKETFVQQLSGNKSVNSPGFLNSVGLAISPLQHCHITAVLGQCTAATLSPNETIIAIVLVTLNKPASSPTTLNPRKENGRLAASSSRSRPTSDVLNDELLNQLLGRFKRKSQAKEEKVEDPVLKAKITYNHSLFPPCHQISYEVTLTVTLATICNRQQSNSQNHKQKPEPGYAQRPNSTKLTCEETENAAKSIVRVLSEGLRSDGDTAASHHTANAGLAVKLLNDFSAAATSLPPDSTRTLEMLRFRYSVLVNSYADPVPPPKRYNPLERRKEERRKTFKPESPGHALFKPELDNNRRDAFEMDREEMDEVNAEEGLADVTNLTRYRNDSLLSGGTHLLGYDCTTDLGKDNAIPPPLFSPKRGPTLVRSSVSDLGSTHGSARTPQKTGYYRDRQHLQTNIGSARFYAAEVEDMARQAFGGATTCHYRIESLHEPVEKDEEVDNHRIEEDANDKARQIWERMRISSEGSGTSAESTEVRYNDESADEAERARECKVIGAPWLA